MLNCKFYALKPILQILLRALNQEILAVVDDGKTLDLESEGETQGPQGHILLHKLHLQLIKLTKQTPFQEVNAISRSTF